MKSKSVLRILLNVILGVLILGSAGSVFAQDTPSGPVYIVQAGDTLGTIAVQFGVTVDDLLTANNMNPGDLIYAGNPLIIPGLEGVTGVLETRPIPFGETLRSLSRRYQIPVSKLVKLNHIVSPYELYVGSSLILPVSQTETPQWSRAVLAPGQSLLEMAVRENANPWNLLQVNQLTHANGVAPGEVLFVPTETLAGPGAFPAPITDVQVSDFYQGETGVIHLFTTSDVALQGTLNNHTFPFFTVESGHYAGLQGVHALASPGLYPLTITGTLPDGTTFTHSQPVIVRERGYLFESITVPPALIDPETTNKEEDFLRPFVNQFTSQKYWQGLFLSPSPCPTCINSGFGNRRSYNGSAFTYFHGGVDFPPVALEITAAADGVVVFAGLLEVRGNFTLIDHGWGIFTAYMHQSELYVKTGDTVKAGQVIGLIGNTGRSTGAHLHWEVWVGGVQVNPLIWLDTPYP
ncbi:MAG TPA: peptidoglycan DD-metalloendopeptidase family protein [Anaerolineales bacterium]|nr:peptidoglycan DD-metalloendopeptidase family protein [Anaerolineales bacterium]